MIAGQLGNHGYARRLSMYLMKTIAKTTVDEGNSTTYVEQRENYGNDN
jgi:hypothetical protein